MEYAKIGRLEYGNAYLEYIEYEDYIYISFIYVPERDRGLGYATKLLNTLIEYSNEQNLLIQLEVPETPWDEFGLTPDELRQWYIKKGFESGSFSYLNKEPDSLTENIDKLNYIRQFVTIQVNEYDNGGVILVYHGDTEDEIGYLSYTNKLNNDWSPKIYINYLTVETDFRRYGIGSLLIEEVKKLYPNEIILLDADSSSKVGISALLDFYKNLGFKQLFTTYTTEIMGYFPNNKSEKDLNYPPTEVMYNTIVLHKKDIDVPMSIKENFRYFLKMYLEDREQKEISLEEFAEVYKDLISEEDRYKPYWLEQFKYS